MEALRQGKWWSATGWLFILALAVRPVDGSHHATGQDHHDMPAAPAETHSHGPHAPAGSPADAPTPHDHSPERTQPCPCASSCSANGAGTPAAVTPAVHAVAAVRTILDAHPPSPPHARASRFRLPLANAPPLPA